MRLHSSSRRPGTSLLEVLAATAVFLIAVGAIQQLMSSATDRALEVQLRSDAMRLCQSKMNEFTSGIESLSGTSGGTIDEGDVEWQWQAEISNESVATNLYRVKITVSRDAVLVGLVEVSLTQLIFDPLQRGQITASSPSSSTTPSSGGSP